MTDKLGRQGKSITSLDHIDPPSGGFDSDSALWYAYKKHKKQRRTSNLMTWEGGQKKELEKLLGDGQHLTCHSEFHYSFQLAGKRVDYWPSTNRWRFNGKSYFGNFKSLCGFVTKRNGTKTVSSINKRKDNA